MRRLGVLLLLLCGCRRLLGFESVQDTPPDGPAPPPIDAIDAPSVDAPIDAAMVMRTFRQGVDGYQGVVDTYIQSGDTTRNDADSQVRWGKDRSTLIKFDLFSATDSTRIPPGATIASATLSLVIPNNNAGPTMVFDVVSAWDGTTISDTFGPAPGIDLEDYDSTQVVASLDGSETGVTDLDVTSSLQRWASGTTNEGWIVLPNAGGGGDATARSSEDGSLDQRPLLTVAFTPP